jgi:L-ornithine N5-monooxygenase
VAVIGGAQSAAEMFQALQDDLPGSDLTWIMRSPGLRPYEQNKFTNELYFPSFVDRFFGARQEGRDQILRQMHRTNYSGVAPALLERLYGDLYLDRIAGNDRRRIVTMAEVTRAREVDGEVVLELTDRRTGTVREVRQDLVFLGTGFSREMPTLFRDLGARLGLDRIAVDRDYRLLITGATEAACYMQGVNEATHGIAGSLLSVLAARAADITQDVLASRAGRRRSHRPTASSLPGTVT